jgi:DNA helicase-2/ATP-dependent DNA helicase PcrA
MQNYDYLETLDAQQREAVLSPPSPLAVMAGAGAGKTKVITARIMNQIHGGIDPNSLFVSAFTKAASVEMAERILRIEENAEVDVSTFHSLMFRFMNSYMASSGKEPYDLYKEGRKKILIQNLLDRPSRDFPNALNLDADISNVISTIGRWKNGGIHYFDEEISTTKQDSPRSSDMYAAAVVYELYEKHLASANSIDFDDMLLKSMDLLASNNEALSEARSTWKGFFVDEAQDTNIVQWKILELIAPPEDSPNLTVVGDLRQCLFSFRGASPEIFEQFINRYKDAKVVDLVNNYRCVGPIVESANKLAENMGMKDQVANRSDGEIPQVHKFDSTLDQAKAIAEDVSKLRESGVSGGDIAVLIRTNAQSVDIESAFVAAGIPYWCNGGGFFQRMEVGDIMAYLQLANGEDRFDLLGKIINKPTRYLGAAFVEAVNDTQTRLGGDIIRSIRMTDSYNNKKLSPKQRSAAIDLSTLLLEIKEKDGDKISPSIAIGKILDKTDYFDWLKKNNGLGDGQDSSRIENINAS